MAISVFSDFLFHLRQKMVADNYFHRFARMEVAAEPGLCPVNRNQFTPTSPLMTAEKFPVYSMEAAICPKVSDFCSLLNFLAWSHLI